MSKQKLGGQLRSVKPGFAYSKEELMKASPALAMTQSWLEHEAKETRVSLDHLIQELKRGNFPILLNNGKTLTKDAAIQIRDSIGSVDDPISMMRVSRPDLTHAEGERLLEAFATMKDKRQPLLADLILSDRLVTHMMKEHLGEWFKGQIRDAKRFVLDNEATIYLAEMCRDAPELIALGQEFCIPPFEKMWVEMPFQLFYKTVNGGREVPPDPRFGPGDTRAGYLYIGPRVYCAASAMHGDKEQAGISPIRYRLNQPFESFEAEAKAAQMMGTSRRGIDFFYWGTSAKKFIGREEWFGVERMDTGEMEVYEEGMSEHAKEMLRSLRANHSWEWIGPEGISQEKAWKHMYQGAAGDLRLLLGLLFYLNQTSEIRYTDEISHGRAMIGNKPSVLVKHSVVHIRLNPIIQLKKRILGGKGSGTMKRLHDVRGHFCFNREGRSLLCGHVWVETKVNQWRCMECPGLKWWKKEHKRGKRKGVVVTTYEVHE